MSRIQFILKARDNPYSSDYSYSGGYLSSGLMNSANFVADMLHDTLGHDTDIIHAVDNNDIDALVTAFRPDIVVIEAYWVVPEKFGTLAALHPNITWVVRNHSATPFAATEGILANWSLRYMDYPNVVLACNDTRTDREFSNLIRAYKPTWTDSQIASRVVCLPNYYPLSHMQREPVQDANFVNIACFGAVRPLKNHLIQAVAAIEYAESVGKTLQFHINGTRAEGNGEPILANLRSLFGLLPHLLVEHPWLPHEQFVSLVRQMDIGLQVSYSETFNIVTADMVMAGVPVVTSSEVRWVHPVFHADPNDSATIVDAIRRALWIESNLGWWTPNVDSIGSYDAQSVAIWQGFITSVTTAAGN